MAADRRQVDAAGAHPQHGRDVLDQRRHALGRAGARRRSAGTPRRRRRRARPWARYSPGAIGTNRWIVRTGAPIAGREARGRLDPAARLVVEPVDAHERAARPRDRALGGQRQPAGGDVAADRDRRRERLVGLDVAGRQAQLHPAPVAARQPVRDLIRLRSGLEQRDGGGATRHRRRQRPRSDGRSSLETPCRRPRRSPRPRPAGSSPPGVSIATPAPVAVAHELGGAQQRGRAARRPASASRPSAPGATIASSAATTSST